MARYRKIDVRIWTDDRFRNLTPLQPSGQALWLYLLTARESGAIPGLMVASEGAIASWLGWSPPAVRRHLQEIEAAGMAKVDRKNHLIWLPKAIHYNRPSNLQAIRSWKTYWDEVPSCQLKVEAWSTLDSAFTASLAASSDDPTGKARAQACLEAWRQACAQPPDHLQAKLSRDARMRAHVGSLSSELLALNSESSLREGGDPPKAADTATGKDLQAVIADFSERFKARTGSNPVWNDRKHIPGVRRILRALKGLTAVLAYSAWFFETDDRFVAEEAKWSPDAFVSSSVVNKWLARNVGQRKSIRDEWKDERAGFLDTSKL